MIKTSFTGLLWLLLCAAPALPVVAASGIAKSPAANTAVPPTQNVPDLSGRLKEINSLAVSQIKSDHESLQNLYLGARGKFKDITVDHDLLNAFHDKSLDWRTRYLIMDHVRYGENKKISKDDEIGLYSGALSDHGENNAIRELAAQSLMEPARTDTNARAALANAAKDKTMPGEVLQSVMTSVGYAGIDDVDTLTGLMGREPKTNNEIGINLNAVRALGRSNDPRAAGMLFKILDESKPDSFFNVTALDDFSEMIKDPEKEKQLRPMLIQRLMKLLDDRSHYGASRERAARLLTKMHEQAVIPYVIKWLKPESEGGGNCADVVFGSQILAEFQAKETLPALQKVVDNFGDDSRWADNKKMAIKYGKKFPDTDGQYLSILECLKKLRGEAYDPEICEGIKEWIKSGI